MSKGFFLLWTGQLVSLLGSSMTGFGISLWLYDNTKSPFLMSAAIFCKLLPSIYLSLFAGPLVDQWSVKQALVATNIGLLLVSAVLLWAAGANSLSVPILFGLLFISGAIESVQSLTFQKSIAVLIKPEFYSQSQGVVSLVENSPLILAPALGALAFQYLGLGGILLFDILTYGVGIAAIFSIALPIQAHQPNRKPPILTGIQWILRHPILRPVQLFFTATNFFNGMAGGLIAAFVLAASEGDKNAWATVSTAVAVASTLGALFLIKRKLNGELLAWITLGTALAAISGRIGFACVSTVIAWSLLLGIRSFLTPLISGANQTLWLRHVPQEQLGTIFGARRVLGQGSYPLAVFLGSWIAKSQWISLNPSFGLSQYLIVMGLLELAVALIAAFLFLRR